MNAIVIIQLENQVRYATNYHYLVVASAWDVTSELLLSVGINYTFTLFF